MYAVIETGGKQYRVQPGATLQVEKLPGAAGDAVEFDRVLLVAKGDDNVTVGTPAIDGAKVTAEIVDQARAKKVLVFKHMRRKDYRRKNGHRQAFTAVKIKDVVAP